jgi:hypothetical protein
MCKFGLARVSALQPSVFRRNAGRFPPFSHPGKKPKASARTWNGPCFPGFVAPASASLRLRLRFRNEAPKNGGVCRWWWSDRVCRAAWPFGIDRLGLMSPPLRASGRLRCANKPLMFRPCLPRDEAAARAERGLFSRSGSLRPWLR